VPAGAAVLRVGRRVDALTHARRLPAAAAVYPGLARVAAVRLPDDCIDRLHGFIQSVVAIGLRIVTTRRIGRDARVGRNVGVGQNARIRPRGRVRSSARIRGDTCVAFWKGLAVLRTP
jgi:hypothetical protein